MLKSYSIVILLAIWFLLVIVKRIRTKRGELEFLLFIIVISGFIVFDVFALYPLDFVILESALYIGFAITLLFFNISALSKKNKHAEKLKLLKKEHKSLITSYESLRKRFIALIDLTKDGLIFRSDDDSMFATDVCISFIGETSNELTQENYLSHIHPDDISGYKVILKKLNKKHPEYEMTYRYKRNNQYVWLKEKGTMIFYEDRSMVIAVVRLLDVKMYPDTEVEMLNNMQIDQAFYEYLQSLNRMNLPYHLVFFELSNIPSINDKYGRDIGDLMMGEFLNKLRYNFVKDEKSVFRLTGIRFAMVIKDERKYKILERALSHGGDLLNFEMRFGNVEQSVYPYFGIQKIDVFDQPLDELVKRTHKALEIAMQEETPENYFIIG